MTQERPSHTGKWGDRSTIPWAARVLGLKASTWGFVRAARAGGKSIWETLHGYVYARWPYAYIGSAIGERPPLRRLRAVLAPFLLGALRPARWADGYHGKVMPTAAAARLVDVREDIAAVVPEQIIPFDHARDLILSQENRIVAFQCPCRAARENPCLPLDVCLVVGEPFASFVLEHHPHRSRAISPQEAIDILEAEAARGHVHHAFFKEAMLGRFYAICNCCTCCCGAISAQRSGTPMVISSGYVAEISVALCRACGTCEKACPFDAVRVNGHAQVDPQVCMGCGVCVRACPASALALRLDSGKPAPLEIPAQTA